MAKIFGLFGSMTGKLADTVMSVRNGVQIARKYQPIVFNPSTQGQVAQRAKMKLMSQLSAICAPEIAIPREGSVSSRNLFVKKNFSLTTYSDDTANINLVGIQLTNSSVGMAQVTAERSTEAITAKLFTSALPAFLDVNRVVYVCLVKDADGTLRFGGSAVATSPGAFNNWAATLPAYSQECVIYAYGIRDNSEVARAKFGNLQALNAETVAKLIVSRTLTESDITLTETTGYILAEASTQVNASPETPISTPMRNKIS